MESFNVNENYSFQDIETHKQNTEGLREVIIREKTPGSDGELHLVETPYREIRPGFWQKVPDLVKDLGVVKTGREIDPPTKEEHEAIMGPDLPPEQRKRVTIAIIVEKNNEKHLYQITYEELRPCCWQKVYGSEKDLGVVVTDDNANEIEINQL